VPLLPGKINVAGLFAEFAIWGAARKAGLDTGHHRKGAQMKRLFLAAGLFTAAASIYSYGQTPAYTQKAVAQIPFDFQTGDVFMPAGKYIISQAGDLVTVRGETGKPSAMLLTRAAPSQRASAGAASLTFTRYDNDYFLARIWSADSRDGRTVPKGKREKELARRVSFAKSDDVAVQTNNLRAANGK
jgi:hypothetical protein